MLRSAFPHLEFGCHVGVGVGYCKYMYLKYCTALGVFIRLTTNANARSGDLFSVANLLVSIVNGALMCK